MEHHNSKEKKHYDNNKTEENTNEANKTTQNKSKHKPQDPIIIDNIETKLTQEELKTKTQELFKNTRTIQKHK